MDYIYTNSQLLRITNLCGKYIDLPVDEEASYFTPLMGCICQADGVDNLTAARRVIDAALTFGLRQRYCLN